MKTPKRFYRTVSTKESRGGFAVMLDGRPLRTPVKAPLEVPARPLADAIAAEWDAQGERINPLAMILTKLANTAIDRVAPQSERVRAEIVGYAASDLVCYRAAEPERLAGRQAAAWDPVLSWAKMTLDADFAVTTGIVHRLQPSAALQAVDLHLRDKSPWDLAANFTITAMLGSALLTARLLAGAAPEDETWSAAHIDEDWQIEHWGEDEEAAARRAARRIEFDAACRFAALSREGAAR
ncbi:ATP12 family chaperone protein [soil metagenome]